MADRKLTIDDLFKIRSILAMKGSPDGRHAVLAIRTINVEKQRNEVGLWLWRDADGRLDRLTRNTQDGSFAWLDNETIVFSSRERDAEEEKKDKPYPKTRLYTLSLRGGDPMLRATLDGLVWEFEPSHDGRRLGLIFSPNPPFDKKKAAIWEKAPKPLVAHHLRYRLDGFGDLPEALPEVHVLATSGETWKKTRKVFGHPTHSCGMLRWVPRSTDLLFSLVNIDEKFPEFQLVRCTQRGVTRRIKVPGGNFVCYEVSPDGKQLAFCANDDRFTGDHIPVPIGVRSLVNEREPWRILHETDGQLGEQRTISDICPAGRGHLEWIGNEALLTLNSEHGRCSMLRVGLDGKATRLGLPGGVVSSCTQVASGILYTRCDLQNPGELYHTAHDKPVTSHNKDIAKKFTVVPQNWTVTSGRTKVETWLWATDQQLKSKKRSSLPLIVYVHGGPHVQTGEGTFHEYTWLAQLGYPVVTCNPRLSTGYGRRHGLELHAKWGTGDVDDILAVREDTLRRYRQFDPKRTIIMGGSYGGYMTNMMITRHPGVFRVAITDRCVANSLSFAGTSDFSNVFPPIEMGVENIWENPKKVWDLSPISGLKNVTEPLLIIHSDQDYRCPVGQAQEMFVGLVELGKKVNEEVRFVMFRGESHGLSRGGRPENRRVRLEENLAWIKKHDRPRSTPRKRR